MWENVLKATMFMLQQFAIFRNGYFLINFEPDIIHVGREFHSPNFGSKSGDIRHQQALNPCLLMIMIMSTHQYTVPSLQNITSPNSLTVIGYTADKSINKPDGFLVSMLNSVACRSLFIGGSDDIFTNYYNKLNTVVSKIKLFSNCSVATTDCTDSLCSYELHDGRQRLLSVNRAG